MDFTDNLSTPMPEQNKNVDLLQEDGTLTPTLASSNSYGTFLETLAKPTFFNPDLSKNKLYRKRMDRHKSQKKDVYSIQFMDKPVEYTCEFPGYVQNYLCGKYGTFIDTKQMKKLKENGLIVIELNEFEKITITKTSK